MAPTAELRDRVCELRGVIRGLKRAIKLIEKSEPSPQEEMFAQLPEPEAPRPAAVVYPVDFERLYKLYPRKEGKREGFLVYAKTILTDRDYQDLEKAVRNYARWCVKFGTEPRYQKHFSTFMNCWQDYLPEEKAGQPIRTVAEIKDEQAIAQMRAIERLRGGDGSENNPSA
jgi:Xaa-Pro aminopeptidase